MTYARRFVLIAALAFPARGIAQQDELLARIWNGVQAAQKKYVSGCGTITERRNSALFSRPLVFRGKFCASGLEKFSLEYTEPEVVRIRFNRDYLNVTTGKQTEVIEVGGNVRRTQAYFSKDNSLENLKKNFEIAAQERAGAYEMRLVPRTPRFRSRLNYLVVRLGKEDFLLRSLEVDGKSGVNSVFTIQTKDLNTPVDEKAYEVYRPK